ncbi:MAG: FGGY family carbohydrate kinase, partial [Acidimicrobiales bacterium]
MAVSGSGLLLGVDLGSSRVKVVLIAAGGVGVATAAVPMPFADTGGRSEASVPSLLSALGQALDGLGAQRERVVAVGLAGMAESGAPLDAAGRPLAPILAWHDPRGGEVAERLTQRLGPELAVRLGQRLRSVSTVAKLGWLVDGGLTGARRWLGVPELALQALTGAEATEHSLAARTGCWDVGAGGWFPETADAAGFSLDLFPEVMAAGQVMGRVTAAGAGRFGLPAGVPVTIAGHDHLAGLVGSGATPDDLGNSVGTAETVIGRSA